MATMKSYDISDCPIESAIDLKNVSDSPLKIAFLDLDDRFIFANYSFCRFFGQNLEFLQGKSFLELICDVDKDTYLSHKKKLSDAPHLGILSVDLLCCINDRPPEPFYVSCGMIATREGTPRYQRVVLRDAAERKEFLETWNSDGDPYNQAQVMVVSVDENGIFTKCTGKLAQNIVPQVIGRHYTELFPGLTEVQDRIVRAMNGESFDVEIFVRGCWYHIWYSPLLDEQGNPKGATWTSCPIDKQKHVETQLKKDVADATSAIKIREEILSIASHEIRNPLTSLSLQIQLIERYLENDKDLDRALEASKALIQQGHRQIKQISTLVEKTLDVTKISSQGLNLDLQPCDLAAILKETTNRCIELANAAHCEISIKSPRNLMGRWDSSRIEQVIENLLTNAIKYGAGRPIHAELNADKDYVTLAVSDQGCGISHADQEKIFDRFVRAQSGSKISGFGMGLYIVKQIIVAHGGTIEVQSEPNQGATFKVKLPNRL